MPILILEDSAHRIAGFSAVLVALGRSDVHVYGSARHMLRDLPGLLPSAEVISLDHDLYPLSGGDPDEDLGDGFMVARWLAEQSGPPRCPVILHTSNGDMCKRMQGVLEHAGWDVRLAGAVGEHWIEKDWLVEVERVLRSS
ncbi:hypothetical protein OT109_12870 [Phycisphaeraceae bacterium D3-23]